MKNYLIKSIDGLLHDYGRFYQWRDYKTFNDRKSVDHGDFAVYKLFDNKEIENYYTDINDYEIIYEAIKYHNKYIVPDDVSSRLMCNIVRDADKIDIIYQHVIGDFSNQGKGVISKNVMDTFNKHLLINSIDVVAEADKLIRTIALIFDLNFKYSYKYLKDNMIIEKLFSKLSEKEKFKSYFDEIEKYIERKIGDE